MNILKTNTFWIFLVFVNKCMFWVFLSPMKVWQNFFATLCILLDITCNYEKFLLITSMTFSFTITPIFDVLSIVWAVILYICSIYSNIYITLTYKIMYFCLFKNISCIHKENSFIICLPLWISSNFSCK